MTGKPINWGKLYSITGTAAVVFAAAGWVFVKASVYAALPGRVKDHEQRISAIEAQDATNSVRLGDRLDNIDRDLKTIFRRLDVSEENSTNQAYASQ